MKSLIYKITKKRRKTAAKRGFLSYRQKPLFRCRSFMPTHPPKGLPPPTLARSAGCRGDVPPYRSSTAPRSAVLAPVCPQRGRPFRQCGRSRSPPPVGRSALGLRPSVRSSFVGRGPTRPLRFPFRQRAPPFALLPLVGRSRSAPVAPAPPSLVLSSSLPCAPQRGVPFQTTGAPVRPLPLVGLLSACARYPRPALARPIVLAPVRPPKGGSLTFKIGIAPLYIV